MADPFVQQLVTVSITSGQSLSAAVDIGGWTLVGIGVPTTWTTAAITFQSSIDGDLTWGEVFDGNAGALFSTGSLTGGTLQYFVALDPAKFRGVRAVKVRSGTQATPVDQANAVTLTLVTRAVF